MSITDATTTIDLSWQEVDVVSFTAGTVADIDSLKSEFEKKLGRGTLSNSTTPTTSEVELWLIRSKEEFMETNGYTFSRRYAYATATSGTYRFALPPDFGGGACRLRDTTNNRTVGYLDRTTFDRLFPDLSEYGAGELDHFTIKNRELWTYPPADGATLELEYTRTGEDNTATDISYIPERYRFKLVDMALVEGFEYLQEFEKAVYYDRKSGGKVRLAKKSDNRQKRATKMRATSWLEG